MIKNLLYIEDGSVDIDALEATLNGETKIIVYRQGSTAPILVQPEQPISDIFDDAWVKTKEELKKFREKTEKLTYKLLQEKSLTKRARKLIERFAKDNLSPEELPFLENWIKRQKWYKNL